MPARRKITEEAEETLVRLLESGADMALAARGIGVSRQAVYKHLKKREGLKERIDRARDIVDDQVQSALFRAATNGNVTAMIFWLKNRRSEHWRDRHDHDIGGDMTVRVVRE